MKKLIILSGMLCLLVSTEATARVDISVGLFGEPAPAYVEAPVYVAPTPIYPSYAEEGGERWHRHDHRDHRWHDRHR
jgi:hypothetical protein